jgi:flagellar protein FlaG
MLIQNITNITPVTQVGRVINDHLFDGKPVLITSLDTEATSHLSPDQLQKTVEKFNDVMAKAKQSLKFSVDDETHKPIIKLIDSETGELIRQIPSEEMRAIARSIDQFQQGMLLTQQV